MNLRLCSYLFMCCFASYMDFLEVVSFVCHCPCHINTNVHSLNFQIIIIIEVFVADRMILSELPCFCNFLIWLLIKVKTISMLQMLTSKDSNFIGYTFKKSDMLKSVGSSGMLRTVMFYYTCSYFLAVFFVYLYFLYLNHINY